MIDFNEEFNIQSIQTQKENLELHENFYYLIHFHKITMQLFEKLNEKDPLEWICIGIDFRVPNGQMEVHEGVNPKATTLAKALAQANISTLEGWKKVDDLIDFELPVMVDKDFTLDKFFELHTDAKYQSLYLAIKLEKQLLDKPQNIKNKL